MFWSEWQHDLICWDTVELLTDCFTAVCSLIHFMTLCQLHRLYSIHWVACSWPCEASVSAGMLFVQVICCWWQRRAVTVTCCGACRVTHTLSIHTSWRCRLWCLLKASCGQWLRCRVVIWRLSYLASAPRNLEPQTLHWLLDNTWSPQGSTSYWHSRFVLGSFTNKHSEPSYCDVISPAGTTVQGHIIIYLHLFLSIQHVRNVLR
jgi:hypothetical protein